MANEGRRIRVGEYVIAA